MDSRKKASIIIAVLAVILVGILGSYAYYSAAIKAVNQTASLSTGTMALVFADNDNGIHTSLNPGESVTKKFTIENTGTLEASMSMDWFNLLNTYLNGSLTYELEYSDTEDGTYTNIVDTTNVPVSNEPIVQTLASELSVPAGETYYYNLIITFNMLDDVNQENDLTASFTTRFSAGQPVKYRYYTLTVDPNGGEWETFTGAQEYQMKNGDTKTISDPVRVGYTFAGWEMVGTSSTIVDGTFSMGIGNTILRAKWSANKYVLTVDPNEGTYSGVTPLEVEYQGTTEIPTPTREGYTFTGWTVSAGSLNGTTFTMSEMRDATLTANWVINNYKYIVYHNQMNVDGAGYTLVSADTDEGESPYGTVINPLTKTYTGFASPAAQSLTIKVENDYPPTVNVVNYNYTRNQYTLTINPNGGTYNSTTANSTMSMYYEASTTLATPTKTGYNFANWTASAGTLSGSTFTMGTSDATVTANYTAKELSITFNANGGTVATQSKTVTYDSTYGELPTPTYSGYIFLGWYTASTGGTEVTSSTSVTITENQTLYAQWEEIPFNMPEAVAAIQSGQIPENVKSSTPNFATTATTNEGVFAMEDDYGTSYYYRGAVENNYVYFAGYYWRIIRVNGDGSVRMIYDGTQAYANGTNNTDRLALTSTAWNANYNDAKYVGWMFGGADGTASTSKESAQTNETDSDIKEKVDAWYKTNIVDAGYADAVSDEIFCNDRSFASDNTGTGYGTSVTYYGARGRLYSNKTPQFTCTQQNDAFTVNDMTNGNGALTYPVGLITADEVSAAGGVYGTSNSSYYLYKGSWYWSLSPYYFDGTYAHVFIVYTIGYLYTIMVSATPAVRSLQLSI